jgi:hypothetical protein
MVRSEYKYHKIGVWVLDSAQRDGEGRGIGRHTPCRIFVAGEVPVARRRVSKVSPGFEALEQSWSPS